MISEKLQTEIGQLKKKWKLIFFNRTSGKVNHLIFINHTKIPAYVQYDSAFQINFIQKLARVWAYARAWADKGYPGNFVISVK